MFFLKNALEYSGFLEKLLAIKSTTVSLNTMCIKEVSQMGGGGGGKDYSCTLSKEPQKPTLKIWEFRITEKLVNSFSLYI